MFVIVLSTDYWRFLKSKGKKIARFTTKGLIRFFAVSLTMSHSVRSEYSVPMWEGFTASPLTHAPKNTVLKPWQILRLDSSSFVGKKITGQDGIEIYRVLASQNSYRIFPQKHATTNRSNLDGIDRSFYQDYILVINTNVDKSTKLQIITR